MNPISERTRCSFLLILLLGSVISAQAKKRLPHCAHGRLDHQHVFSPDGVNGIASTGYSGTGSNINVVYQRCDWTIDPTAAKSISGTVTVKFVTLQPNVNQISLDLNKTSFSNANLSVTYLGSPVTFSFPSSGNVHILRINLPAALPLGSLASVVINYAGVPPNVSGDAEGYQKKSDASGNPYIYTLSESYEDKDWWPCKADMQDKIDSMDINIRVPNGFRAATNGAFLDSNTLSGGFRTFRYKLKYPIATYLVAVGVARYAVFDRGPVNINGTNVPVWYFLFPRSSYTTILNALDKSKQELVEFSSRFGDYPFKNEKHGYYEFGWSGGMEHQSMSAMGAGALTSSGTIAHELAHQWFGDKVTFATWNHLWLAEGFAKYLEVLAAELVPGTGTASSILSGIRSTAMSSSYRQYSAYIPNGTITSSTTLWGSPYGVTVYYRGAMVVSMLRALVGDEKFYLACRNYLNDPVLAYRSATTADLISHFNAVAGTDLTPFFNNFVMGAGYPSYTINWGNKDKRLNIQVTGQTRNYAGSTTYFHSPIVLRIRNNIGTRDTTVVIYDRNGSLSHAGNGIMGSVSGNIIGFNLSFVPATVTYDPNSVTLTTGTVSFLASLPIDIVNFNGEARNRSNELTLTLQDTYTHNDVVLEKSFNSNDFSELGQMKSRGELNEQLVFSYTDQHPAQQVVYYRARITDVDGTVKYSSVVKLANQHFKAGMSINPTVTSGPLNIILPFWHTSRGIRINLVNAQGVRVKTYSKQVVGTTTTINVSDLRQGIYWLEVNDENGFRSVRQFSVVH